ncbi:MAG: ferric reductase-like transmembrane domain-containing protein [Desulfovibrionaceae bacterium]|nr:ferric reductase-like transmembrane domain-containing protein [Desulfovibrionaceae bacterium]
MRIPRIAIILGAWLLAITLAWWAVPPLADAPAAAPAWWNWYLLRQNAMYLTGLWSIGAMSLAMVLALRLPALERPLGGMDQVYRLHKWAGIGAALTAILHWGAHESGGWIKHLWNIVNRPARDAVLPGLGGLRDLAEHVGEWAFYALLVMVALTLLQRLLPYRRWRVLHRAMPVLYLMLAFHAVALTPLAFWSQPLGLLLAGALTLGCLAALWSLAGRIGRRRSHAARVHDVTVLGPAIDAPLEVICAMPPTWPGHRAGQFVFASFDEGEGAHPFTIASAPGALGHGEQGEALLRLIIKPLGDYTRGLAQRLRAGQAARIEGPYGRFGLWRRGARRQQVWVAGGVGVTPFLALLEARQPPASARQAQQPAVQMHYCTRDASRDALLPRLSRLCGQAQPPVALTVHSAAQGQRLTAQQLRRGATPLDIWFCGPEGLGQTLRKGLGTAGVRFRHEVFAMR